MRQLEPGKYLGINQQSYNLTGVIVTATIYTSEVSEEWHFHENNHLSFILKGGSREQRKNAEFESIPGTLICYPAGELHRNRNALFPTHSLNIELENSFISQYEIFNFNEGSFSLNTPQAKFNVLKIFNELTFDKENAAASTHLLLLDILSSSKKERFQSCPRWTKNIAEVLNDRWDENIALADLAKMIGIHPVTLSKYFPKYFSCTISEYLRNIRVEKAIILITTTNLPFTEIALRCAFYDQSHFIHVFKAATGYLPSKLRKS